MLAAEIASDGETSTSGVEEELKKNYQSKSLVKLWWPHSL